MISLVAAAQSVALAGVRCQPSVKRSLYKVAFHNMIIKQIGTQIIVDLVLFKV